MSNKLMSEKKHKKNHKKGDKVSCTMNLSSHDILQTTQPFVLRNTLLYYSYRVNMVAQKALWYVHMKYMSYV
jgi:Holliday junction resolvasome RuvABC ATP-dependent DNA helicase subunit